LKKIDFFSLLQINFLVFPDCFDVLMSKIIFLKINKKYYFDTIKKIYFKKQLLHRLETPQV
jgi:hypothetical protein